jgi:hypothetical protein
VSRRLTHEAKAGEVACLALGRLGLSSSLKLEESSLDR